MSSGRRNRREESSLTPASHHFLVVRPAGTLSDKLIHTSKVYDGMKSNYWIYVPAEYDPRTPAALTACMSGWRSSSRKRWGQWNESEDTVMMTDADCFRRRGRSAAVRRMGPSRFVLMMASASARSAGPVSFGPHNASAINHDVQREVVLRQSR